MHHFNSVLLLQITICNDTDGDHNNGATIQSWSHETGYEAITTTDTGYEAITTTDTGYERGYYQDVNHNAGTIFLY